MDNKFDWKNISIEKYYRIKDILEEEGDDDITKNVKLVSAVLDIPEDDVWNMDLVTVGGYIDNLSFLGKFDLPRTPNLKISLPGYKLEVMKDVSRITIAQYVDYQSFVSLPLREGMEKILSIFLIPEGHRYNEGYDILDLQKTIRENLSFGVAEGLLGFFLKEYGRSLMRSLRFLRRTARRTKDPEKKAEMLSKEREMRRRMQDLISSFG